MYELDVTLWLLQGALRETIINFRTEFTLNQSIPYQLPYTCMFAQLPIWYISICAVSCSFMHWQFETQL